MPSVGLGGLPRDARVAIVAWMVAAAIVVGGAASALVGAPPSPVDLTISLLLAGAVFLVQWRAPTLLWRGRRLSIHPDEALLYLGFVLVAPPLVLLSVLAGGLAAQRAAGRPPLKMAFNVATNVLATSVGASVMLVAVGLGAPLAVAALAVPLVVSALSQLAVAALLSRLAGDGLRGMLRPELGISIAISGVGGATLGALAVALFRWHPAATIALLPVGILLGRVMALEYRHHNELLARRALASAAARFSAEATEDAAMEAARATCFEVFDLSRCAVRLADGRAREWTRATFAGDEARLEAPLPAAGGAPLGSLEVVVPRKSGARLAEDQELLELVASYLAMALASLRAEDARRRAARLVDLQDLVRGVAHEVNNPLMYASGALEMAAMDLEGDGELDRPETAGYVRAGLRGLKRIETISRALAQVARSGRLPTGIVDVNALVREVGQENGLDVRLPEEPLTVRGHARSLRDALAAIAKNATEAGGATTPCVVASENGAWIEIAIADAGAGVAPEARQHLFSPFYTTKPDGVGLSLATALRVARDHEGDIAYEDAPGGGACFRFKLPRAGKA